MSAPVRVQRQRTKGWRMPPNTVYVGRPSRWGNPYNAGRTSAVYAVEAFAEDYISDLRGEFGPDWFADWLEPLRGKNLACWCPLDQPCHADVLLELANR